ncbi:MAG: ABC transporter permease [Actinomycetota bacterium]|nr:ABC transporter permease [Actinomycetota bacterium]
MSRYLAERVVWLLLSLVTLSMITFGLGVLAPGDPAEVVLEHRLNQSPPHEDVVAQRRLMGLDRPLPVQYLRWLSSAARGDLGHSWLRGLRVSDALRERIPRTAALAGSAAVISVLIGVPAGVLAATRRNSLADHACRLAALLGASVPSYFAAYVLILVFAVRFRALPVFGFGSAANLVLPAVTLALGPAAVLARLTRSTVLGVLGEDYIRTARAKGASQPSVLVAHALRNSLIPILTVVGLSLGHLLGGALIVEWVFAWPGMGELAISAIQARDYPLIQGFVLFAGTVYVVVNFSVDLGYAWLDPRVRVGGRR